MHQLLDLKRTPRRLRRGAGVLLVAAGMAVSVHTLAQAPMPAPITSGGITYLSGGVGEGEQTALRAQAKDYSMLIEFAEVEAGNPRGVWTADVSLAVKSGQTLVATLSTNGPLLLLRLAPGTYTLDATHGGVLRSKTVQIKAGAAPLQERFVWPATGSLGGNPK